MRFNPEQPLCKSIYDKLVTHILLFSPEYRNGISCNLSPDETVFDVMSDPIFLVKIRKYYVMSDPIFLVTIKKCSKCRLLKHLPRMLSIKCTLIYYLGT